MIDDAVGRCPDPQILAQFAEGILDGERRSDIGRHIGGCPECALVVGETVRFLGEGKSAAPSRPWWRLAAAAALAAIAIPTMIWRVLLPDPLARIRDAAASAEHRHLEGNLHGFEWAPFRAPRSTRDGGPALELRAAAERTARVRGDSAAARHARGVALLLLGDTGRAIPNLADAARSLPRRAAYWNDLAVAHIAAGATSHDRSTYERAVAAADRALALSPALAAAAFNRAVALEHLRRRDDALQAYRRAYAAAPQSAWSAEIRRRIEILERVR